MYKKIKNQFEYNFKIEKDGLYVIEIEAACQKENDLKVEINQIQFREITVGKNIQTFNIPPAWNGSWLKGLSKKVIFIIKLSQGRHSLKFIAKNEADIIQEPIIKLLEEKLTIKILENIQSEKRNRQAWITIVLVDLSLNFIDAQVACQKRFWDSDDVKLIIDNKIQKNSNSSWWGKNWLWQGRKMQGNPETKRIYANLGKGIHYIELWADEQPMINSFELDLGETENENEDNKVEEVKPKRIPTVENPEWTGDFSDDTEQMILARAIWGEARGTSREVKIAVAWSIKNRLGIRDKWDSYHNIILDPSQYSCFWERPPRDANLQALKSPLKNQGYYGKWKEAYKIVGQVINGEITDPTKGANHYYDDSIGAPFWATKDNFVIKIENIFFHKL
ncbi:MAG: hypothetical protein ACD_11C00054G0013 [uncultured bacterium]|nr:MAG: hypothetical protein ACD_11C00054G0013 [uncultured bacterium]HBR72087.1 hypothetical protein [Candidatus Moranbacteria bacterium]